MRPLFWHELCWKEKQELFTAKTNPEAPLEFRCAGLQVKESGDCFY
jgi:hypothetical protein